MPWSRETPWRQGRFLLPESFERLGVSKEFPECDIALVISHDCDVAHDNLMNEPNVEFVLGKKIDAINGNNEHGKNPRILHLTVGAPAVVIELHASKRVFLSKERLFGHEPDRKIDLDTRALEILRRWLMARYSRQAFPDSLNERLLPIAKILEKEGKRHLSGIIGYWIDYQPRDEELPPEQPYELWLYIVYSSDDMAYAEVAEKIANSLKDNFAALKEKSAAAGDIELRDCAASSDYEFTLRDLRDTVQYRLEYLSFRRDPPGPMA